MPLPQLVEVEYDWLNELPSGWTLFYIDGDRVILPTSATKVDADRHIVTMPRELAQGRGLI